MLHVLVGPACNNNCLFCMEEDRDARDRHMAAQSPEDVRRMILEYPHTDEILFTSGEPTLCEHLPTYVQWAKQRGFHTVGIITNGRRFAYPDFLRHLVDAGVNRVTVSIHGHTSKLHDGLTRTPGSFRQTRAGLSNCAQLKKERTLRVHTSTVITRRNLPHLPAICSMLRALDVDEIVFNVMMAKGRGAQHFDALMPRYGEVVAAFRALHAGVNDETRGRIRVVDMPPCVMRELPPGMAGDLEDYDQYEPTGSTGISGFEVLNPASSKEVRVARFALRGRARALSEQLAKGGVAALAQRVGRRTISALSRLRRTKPPVTLHALRSSSSRAIRALRKTVSQPALSQEHPHYVTHRSLKDQFLRVQGPPCARCTARNSCPGVWEVYADRYGWDEFRPLDTAWAD